MDACMPAIPPPITSVAFWVKSTVLFVNQAFNNIAGQKYKFMILNLLRWPKYHVRQLCQVKNG
jgi:hypothetical protein